MGLSLKVNKKKRRRKMADVGRVYLMRFMLPGDDEYCWKVGKSSGCSSKARLIDVVSSIYDAYRHTCDGYIKRDREVSEPFKVETLLHKYFKEYSWRPEKKFSGSSEFFKGIDEDELVRVYELAIKGEDIGDNYDAERDDGSEVRGDVEAADRSDVPS